MSEPQAQTTEQDLAWALERVKTFDPSKGLMPYQKGMMAMADEIERLRNALHQSIETVKLLQARDDYVTGCLV